ncbi:MAG TPA: hypothetical protein VGR50_08510 [Terriglobales bacterium]|nr:hypothetical protein [Terriglobales bacterium]
MSRKSIYFNSRSRRGSRLLLLCRVKRGSCVALRRKVVVVDLEVDLVAV